MPVLALAAFATSAVVGALSFESGRGIGSASAGLAQLDEAEARALGDNDIACLIKLTKTDYFSSQPVVLHLQIKNERNDSGYFFAAPPPYLLGHNLALILSRHDGKQQIPVIRRNQETAKPRAKEAVSSLMIHRWPLDLAAHGVWHTELDLQDVFDLSFPGQYSVSARFSTADIGHFLVKGERKDNPGIAAGTCNFRVQAK
jgi:hypothetical protein